MSPSRREGVGESGWGWGPRVLPRGRESTLEAEGQRRPCRRAGVGPQSLTARPRAYARGRGTAKTVRASEGWAPESYPETESLRSRPRDSEDRARRAGVGPREQ